MNDRFIFFFIGKQHGCFILQLKILSCFMTRDIFISNENQVIKSGFNKDGCAHVNIRVIALENIKTLFTHVAVVLSY